MRCINLFFEDIHQRWKENELLIDALKKWLLITEDL